MSLSVDEKKSGGRTKEMNQEETNT